MNSMFKDKRKNIIAITFTAFYIIILILDTDFRLPWFENFRYSIISLTINLIPLITPIFALVFLLTFNRTYKFKKWLFPIAFGVKFIRAFLMLCTSFTTFNLIISAPEYALTFLCSFLTVVAIGFMFIGTLFDFKYVNFLKFGAISCALLNFATIIIDFIAVGGFEYLQSIPNGVPVFNLIVLIKVVASILFYIGIFILTINKKRADLV